jgi:hypothetical protein
VRLTSLATFSHNFKFHSEFGASTQCCIQIDLRGSTTSYLVSRVIVLEVSYVLVYVKAKLCTPVPTCVCDRGQGGWDFIINSNHLKEEAKENTLDNQPKLLQI